MNDQDKQKKESLEWTKCIYAQAWEQYVHEDNLIEERNKTYLTVVTIILSLLGILTTVAGILIEKSETYEMKLYAFIIIILGSACILIAFSFILDTWERVTKAGDKYVNLRFETILEIETEYGIGYGIAQKENSWKKYGRGTDWVGGFKATLQLIKNLQIIVGFFICGDVVCSFLWLYKITNTGNLPLQLKELIEKMLMLECG